MRAFSKITVGKIIEELHSEGLDKFSRSSFYRIQRKIYKSGPRAGQLMYPDFPSPKTASGWRVYTREEADRVKAIIRRDQGLG